MVNLFANLFGSKDKQTEEAKKLVDRLMKNIELNNELMGFAMDLRDKYDNCNDYELYHVLIKSDPPDKNQEFLYFDFSEDDSIWSFLKNKEKELEDEIEKID